MLAGIAFWVALGAEPSAERGAKLQLQMPQLALRGEGSSSVPPVENWPVEPARTAGPRSQKHNSRLNLVAPIVLTSIGTVILGLDGLALAGAHGSCGDPFCALLEVVAIGSIGLVGGIVFLVGAVWLFADLVINAQASVNEPPEPRRDPEGAERQLRSGMLLARF